MLSLWNCPGCSLLFLWTNIYLTLSLALDINLCGTNCPSLVAESISNLLACGFTGQEFGGGSGIVTK